MDLGLQQGAWYLHQFTLPDAHGLLRAGAALRPLRFVGCNTRIDENHLHRLLAHLDDLDPADLPADGRVVTGDRNRLHETAGAGSRAPLAGR